MRIVCDLKIFTEAVNRQVVLNDDECVARENKTHLIIHTALDECDTKAVVRFYSMYRNNKLVFYKLIISKVLLCTLF